MIFMRGSWIRFGTNGRTVSSHGLDPIYAQWYIYTVPHIDPFATLADPTRRLIVEALGEGERAVNDLVALVDIDQSGVSRHLRILGESGFVTMRKLGTTHLYQLRPEPFRELDGWVSRYRGLWQSRLDRLGEELARRRGRQRSRSNVEEQEGRGNGRENR
jgi:DNA-binding transcriptional ArsR family regulator